jgi:hypothetical protein
MQPLSIDEFREQRDRFDRHVANAPDVDPFCSSSYWILPAFHALFPSHEAWIRSAETTDGYVALARGYHPRIGNYLQPLEASWGLANPIIGCEVPPLVDEFARHADAERREWDMLFLSGLFEDSEQSDALVRGFEFEYTVGVGPSMGRHIASLDGGFDDWFERRSSKFRSNIRRAERKADEAGVETEYRSEFEVGASEAVFERILAIERNSWKGENNSGIASGPMHDFYGQMIPMLIQDGAFRAAFLTLDETDIAYCFGGIFERRYRGLQLSFHDDYGDYSPGNLAQIAMLRGLCREGVQTYDMGQAMEYKSRWADRRQVSHALIVRQ